MLAAKPPRLGVDEGMKLFQRKKDREAVQRELDLAGAAVRESKVSGADISSAGDLLERARDRFEEGRLDEARRYIRLAEKQAETLEKKYTGARKSIAELFKRIQKMKELGMETHEFEALLAKAKKRMEEVIEENGISFPNYEGARAIATRAAKIALRTMRQYESASNAVFVAKMILDNTMKSMVYVDSESLRTRVFAEVIELLKRADEKIASGELKEAYELSVNAERRIETLKKRYQEACEAYKTAEKSLVEAKEKGIRSSDLAKIHEAAGHALVEGSFEPARVKSLEVSSEIRSLEGRKKRAEEMIKKAEDALEAAKSTGFDFSEAQKLLEEARWAYERGIYQRAINCGEDSLKRAAKISSIHVKVTESLEETKKKVDALRELGIEISNELEEVVEKAEKELLMGDYVNSNEELMIARVLIGSLERKYQGLIPGRKENPEIA